MNASGVSMSFQNRHNRRAEARSSGGRFRGGRLVPVMATAVKGSEGGMLNQSITAKLDPILGELITPMFLDLYLVFVPIQAIDAIKDPVAAYAGMTEVIRQKLLTGAPLFNLETEGEISRRCGIAPRSIGGVKRVNEMVRLAHNCAVNFLRQRKYVKATKLLHTNTAVTPAILGQTVLERLNGVLVPEDRVNGSVDLQLPSLQLPVSGIGVNDANEGNGASHTLLETTGSRTVSGWSQSTVGAPAAGQAWTTIERDATTGRPKIYAALNGTTAGSISLQTFYDAERMDRLVRTMRQIVDENPEYGEEMILSWAHGLNIEPGRMPFLLAERQVMIVNRAVEAMDTAGVQGDVMRSDLAAKISISVPVPSTELGGVIITFATLRPDETLGEMPHPFLSNVWGADNFVADELALDPVPVTVRDLDSDCAAGSEATVALYTGYNELKRSYVNYGWNRHVNLTTLAAKTAMWQYRIPTSVTPDNILYPADIPHTPFADTAAEVVTYQCDSVLTVGTPLLFGPSPVEELAIIETKNLFEEV
jgi:hypothetical protein